MATAEDQTTERPVSAVEGTWPLDEWPVDVQRVDDNGVDLSLIEYTLAQSPAQRLTQLEEFVATLLAIWKNGESQGSALTAKFPIGPWNSTSAGLPATFSTSKR